MDFFAEGLHRWLDHSNDGELDQLDYGVIGLDADGKACRYSAPEARMAGLEHGEVLGRPFFADIARCMNDALVAHRFTAAHANGEALDVVIDYVLAFRLQTTPVRLRLLASPTARLDYLLVLRLSPTGQ